jgi:hypothetical protein
MAKHVLDLFELYKLVIAKGGLVEVINKKLWREITKGLNLPSSITSAAFTLRTQYMKYLYPYECEKLKLSSPQELQTAIDGNRREGRRPAYGFEYSSPNGISQNSNGILLSHPTSSNQSNIDLIGNHHHQHHAFLAAAAAAVNQIPPQQQQQQQHRSHHMHHHLFDPANLNPATSNHLNHFHMQAAAAASPVHMGIPTFLKPYLDITSQASLHRDGLIMEANNNNVSDETSNSRQQQKRCLDMSEQLSLDVKPENCSQNKSNNEYSSEPPAKRILIEQQQNSNKIEITNDKISETSKLSKLTKIKILPNKGLLSFSKN